MAIQEAATTSRRGSVRTKRHREDPQDLPPSTTPIGSGGSGGPLTRVTVNLTRKSMISLERAIDESGDTRTDTINRALQIYDLVLDLLKRSGGRCLHLKLPNGETERVYIT